MMYSYCKSIDAVTQQQDSQYQVFFDILELKNYTSIY